MNIFFLINWVTHHLKTITEILLVVFILFVLKNYLTPRKKLKLFPELIPYPMHYKNVRAVLSAEDWKNIAKIIYKKSKFQCDICANKGRLECHEIWDFDENNHYQRLVGLTSLCPLCHQVKHIGFAKKRGLWKETIQHMATVNNISIGQAKKNVYYAELLVKKRNKEYFLDLTYLNQFSFLPRKYTNYENNSCQSIRGNY